MLLYFSSNYYNLSSAGEKALSDKKIHDRDIQWLEQADGSLRSLVTSSSQCPLLSSNHPFTEIKLAHLS